MALCCRWRDAGRDWKERCSCTEQPFHGTVQPQCYVPRCRHGAQFDIRSIDCFVCFPSTSHFPKDVLIASSLFAEIMDLVTKGHIKPISPVTVFPFEDIVSAFRFLRAGTHIGKVVISNGASSHVEVPVGLLCSLVYEKY
jgi:hypothetical protein